MRLLHCEARMERLASRSSPEGKRKAVSLDTWFELLKEANNPFTTVSATGGLRRGGGADVTGGGGVAAVVMVLSCFFWV